MDFRLASSLDEEAWFRRKTSLKVEMVTKEAGASSEFRGTDSTMHQECSLRALENFPTTSTVEYREQGRLVDQAASRSSPGGLPV